MFFTVTGRLISPPILILVRTITSPFVWIALNNMRQTISLDQIAIKDIAEMDDADRIIDHGPTQQSIVCRLFLLIQPLHIKDTHTHDGDNKSEPAVFCQPFPLKSQNIFVLSVALINNKKVLIDKVADVGSWEELEVNISKIILKVAPVLTIIF
jgi:hypothetical protein